MGSKGVRMQLFAVAVILQLAIQAVPSASLGLDDSAYWAKVDNMKEALPQSVDDEPSGDSIQVEMLHFQHAMENLSITERVQMAVKRSVERLNYFHSRITKQDAPYQTAATFSSPVYSNQGSYLMSIQLGSPPSPVKFVAIADTGSDLVWIQGMPCTNCFQQPDPMYDPSRSPTAQKTTCSDNLCKALPRNSCNQNTANCQYYYAYGDQSTTQGDFYRDIVTLTSTQNVPRQFYNFGFGVGHNNKGTFQDTDGLVGLGQGPLSLVSQLGSNFDNVFSYCLTDFYSSSSKTSPLYLGSVSVQGIQYTPLVTNNANPTFYYVDVRGIQVGGQPLQYPSGTFAIDSSGNGGFILDSGTTVTQLPQGAYKPLVSTLESLINYPRVDGSRIGFDLCYDLSGTQNPSVPSVVFQFQGVNLDLPGNNIFLQVDNAGTFCLAIQGSSFSLGIYGNVQQQNFQVVHDRANRRIGNAGGIEGFASSLP
ncbi:hypothetical protein R1sor_007271 [Riccia sorocarpa]|uniref:Peptidase A1 domain-containing protein n=1 Tax=Riccia sorocarpa TaxID=122646 RepID=A0ABD3HU59_9MARC